LSGPWNIWVRRSPRDGIQRTWRLKHKNGQRGMEAANASKFSEGRV